LKYLFSLFKIILFVLVFSALQGSATAQLRVSAGGFVGGGFIKGDSPNIGSFSASFFIETNTILFTEVTPRLSIVFARDFNSIIPNVRKPYFPFVQGVTFKGITTQYFEDHIFLEEGFGGFELTGFKIGAGIEYGITFNNTLAQYSSLHLYFNYTL